jgi:hypothetical protein
LDVRVIEVLDEIKDRYGDMIFYNHLKTRNVMHDLASDLHRERLHVGQFLEMNGYFQMKYAGHSYRMVRERLIRNYEKTYEVHHSVAEWIVDVFGVLLGYSGLKNLGTFQLTPEAAAVAPPVVEVPQLEKPEASVSVWEPTIPPVAPVSPTPTPAPKPKAPDPLWWRISADYHSVAVMPGGYVVAVGPNDDGQCNVQRWRNIRAVSTGPFFTVGLRENGTVVACGRNDFGQCQVRTWRDIVAISAGARHTVGLREDGSLLACGQNKMGECNVLHWRNIVHVVAGNACTFGIKKDGGCLVSGDNRSGDLQVSHLEGVADVAYAGPGRIIALMQDGTLARIGRENHMRKNFSRWKDVRQISAAPDYFAGLMADGTVKLLAYFWQDSGVEAATADWRDILAIAAGRHHIIGWRSDGRLTGAFLHPDISKDKGQLSVSRWEM